MTFLIITTLSLSIIKYYQKFPTCQVFLSKKEILGEKYFTVPNGFPVFG